MHDHEKRPLVSIIIPALNEEDNVAELRRQLIEVTDTLPFEFEFLVIDNNSTDSTGVLLKEFCREDRRWRYIKFSRTFPIDSSLLAGYQRALGEAMIVVFSDLQEPPALIPVMLAKWQEGYDIVYGVHTARVGDSLWMKLCARIAYRLVSSTADIQVPLDASDFRLISRRACDALLECGESYRYTRGLIAWLGFRQASIEYHRQPRLAGKSKGSFVEYFRYLTTAVTAHSIKPFAVFFCIGAVFAAISAFLSIWITGLLLVGNPVSGTALLFLWINLSATINCFGLWIIGEYIGRTYMESKRRPPYVIEETQNFPLKSNSVKEYARETSETMSFDPHSPTISSNAQSPLGTDRVR